jgi:glycosyltransferase involved in cell wall biosynthesis
MAQRETWLVLSHAFNMDGRAASHTVTDKIPYFLAQGVTPVVVSAVTGRHDAVVEHHQVLPLAPSGLRFDLRHLLRQTFTGKASYKIVSGLATLPLLPFYFIERLLIDLEPHWSWSILAYFKGARLIRNRQCSAIYSAGSAWSAHLAGYWLAKKTGLPWIAEVHDPMIFRDGTQSGMRTRVALWLEGKICEHADVAVWFTDAALYYARQRHPVLGDRGKVMIPGADRPDFGKIPYVRGAELVIGHFGSLAPTRNLAVFLDGLGQLLRRRPELANFIRLEIYGSSIDAVSAQAIAQLPFPGIVREFGRLERDPETGESGRDRVLKRMQTVDALLLLHGLGSDCEEYIPSKFYEYLWTERPILGLVWNNEQLAGMLRERGHWAVAADDASGAAGALEALVARWLTNDLADSGKASPYTPSAAVAQMIGWVDEVRRRRGERGR